MAGMGNQMFEYAFARALSLEYSEKLIINPYFMTLAGIGAGRKGYFNNVLEYLNIPKDIRFMKKSEGYLKGIPTIAEFVMLRKNGRSLHGKHNFHKLINIGKFYTDDCFDYYEPIMTNANNKSIIGYYQCDKYFRKYNDTIKKELLIIKEPSDANKMMMKEISSVNAVCVHIRRGDYVSNSKNASLVVCDESYYQRGISYIKDRVDNPVFYVFSDNNEEIEWIKTNYNLGDNIDIRYVMLNNPDYEELRLMYHCKHFVIANSTFSWWGAYLSDNEEKIVVAPKIWNKEYKDEASLYTENMVKI